MKAPRWRLFPKYATLIIAVVASVLGASSAVSLVFSWREIRSHLVALQAEKAQGAATRIEQYILDIEHQLGWTAFPRVDPSADALEQRRIEYLKLQRQVPAITELVWIGADGRERLRVSRLAMDALNAGTDLSKEPAFVAARGGRTWFGPVHFRKGTEPYMAIARPAGGDGGVTVADVNLKFVWDVVSRIKIGAMGLAYVVDATGTLIAHPDISLVLKKTDLKSLPQVAALRGDTPPSEARDLAGQEVLAASARIPTLNWSVFVESPRAEAFAPLYDSIVRLALLLVGGLLLAAAASFFLARALVRPIRALQEGTARIGAGELGQRIDVQSGDELEDLAERFNRMSAELQASYAGLERKVEERTRELSDALEQQTATAEVLQVISGSVSDAQPVFQKILQSCRRLFGEQSTATSILLIGDDDRYHLIDYIGPRREAMMKQFPRARADAPAAETALRERRVLRVADVLNGPDTPETIRQVMQRIGSTNFALVMAPMLWKDEGIGVISAMREVSQPFNDKEVALLKTFADQAAIAIQNARLFNETREGLDRQTAISEILRVISASPSDVQPVFETIVRSAVTLCSSTNGAVFRFDGELLHYVAGANFTPEWLAAVQSKYPLKPDLSTISGRALLSGTVVHIDDVLADPQYDHSHATKGGWRRMLAVPMLREGVALGVIVVAWAEPGRTPQSQEDLLCTFAEQAVIAIENARLFNETKEALEQQTATAEVLRVISSSVADTAPVFDKILESCSHLFESSEQGIVLVGSDRQLHLGAHRGSARERLQAMFPVPIGDGPESRAMVEQRVLHYADVLRDAPPDSRSQMVAAALGGRNYSQVFAPMRWEGQGVGYLYVTRQPPQPFNDKEIDLLKTFADQAVIAIENARLFHALEDKSRQLEAANRHKSEFLANMSHELRTPLNAIIGFSEVLTEQMFGEVNDKQMEYLQDIHSSGQHLLSLINDVLDLSKIEAGKMELDLSCFDLGLLLEHSATLVRERAQRHGLTLELQVDDGLGEWVADARKVKQVVVNLLSNAVKFTPNGGRVSVRARRLNGVDGRAGEWAEVSVSDTGVGIAPADQSLVFEEFRQASGDVLRKAEGTGLGLALVKRFVELHGGTVSLDSEPGRGSTFRFVLPQHEVKVLQ
jgi:signal transduction histidine kinase